MAPCSSHSSRQCPCSIDVEIAAIAELEAELPELEAAADAARLVLSAAMTKCDRTFNQLTKLTALKALQAAAKGDADPGVKSRAAQALAEIRESASADRSDTDN